MLDKVIQKLKNHFDNNTIQNWDRNFSRLQMMPGAGSIFEKISECNDIEQIKDYLAEALYALIFAGLRFDVEIIKADKGKRSPDLKISKDGHETMVEITRFRKIYPGP